MERREKDLVSIGVSIGSWLETYKGMGLLKKSSQFEDKEERYEYYDKEGSIIEAALDSEYGDGPNAYKYVLVHMVRLYGTEEGKKFLEKKIIEWNEDAIKYPTIDKEINF